MYIICDKGKKIINTDNAISIGYEKIELGGKSNHRVFAYSGSVDNDGENVRFLIGIYQLEAQAQYVVSYIVENLEAGTNVITV